MTIVSKFKRLKGHDLLEVNNYVCGQSYILWVSGSGFVMSIYSWMHITNLIFFLPLLTSGGLCEVIYMTVYGLPVYHKNKLAHYIIFSIAFS